MLAGLAGCGCLMLLVIAGVMGAMVYMRRSAASDASGPTVAPVVGPAAGAAPGAPAPAAAAPANAAGTEQAAAQYLVALGQSVLTAARGEYAEERFGSPHVGAIPAVLALGAQPSVRLVVAELGGSAGGHQHVRTVIMAFPDGRLRASEAKLGQRPPGARFDAAASPELSALVGQLGDGLLQRGQCPTLLALPELDGLPQPLIAQLTRELGESRIECQGLRSWPGFRDAWEPHAGDLLVIADGADGPVLVEAQLRVQRGVLAPARIRQPRSR